MGEDKVTKFEEVLGWVNGWVEGTVFADGTGTSIALLIFAYYSGVIGCIRKRFKPYYIHRSTDLG